MEGMKGPTLFEIGDEMRQLDSYIQELGGDVSDPEVEKAIDEYLEANRASLADKLEGYGWLIKDKALRGKARKEAADSLAALAKQDAGLAARLKDRVTEFFKLNKLKTVETASFKYNLQGSGGKRPLKLSQEAQDDVRLLPKKYVRMVPALDMDLLRADLEKVKAEDGQVATSDALRGLAWLEPLGQHLVIK